jgi:hypothetical protein
MENTEKKYVSYLGYDFTQYVKTEEDVTKFNRICELEKLTQRPLKECVHEVAEVLNLSAELKGHKRHVYVQGKLGSN